MDLTQKKIDLLNQNLRKKRLRMELLNFDMQTIDTIEGHVVEGSIVANATNPIRRTGTIRLAIPNNPSADTLLNKLDGFTIEIGGKVWIDKHVKIFVGIDDITSITQETTWYKLGVFLINKPTRSFSADDFTIYFECVDLMAKLTGQRNGQLTGITTVIEKGHYETDGGNTVYVKTLLSQVIIDTITELGGFSQYSIYPIPDTYKYLPYDIKLGVGSTVYDVLKQLMDILSTWQMYFDLDGVFVVEPIPSGVDDIVYEVAEEQYISDTMNVDFENVKNQVVIYGRTNILSYYTENSSASVETKLSSDSGISSVNVDLNSFSAKIIDAGTYIFLYSNEVWSLNGTTVQLSDYGITYLGTSVDNAEIQVIYTPAVTDNVAYVTNADNTTSTLVLKYSTIQEDRLTTSGTTFGFYSLDIPNQLPITNIEIWSNGEKVIYTRDDIIMSLVKFENSNNSFGVDYTSNQVEIGSILPQDIYFVRIFDTGDKDAKNRQIMNENGYVDINKSIVFEFMGKQSVSYTLVNDNEESPFYINNGINSPNFYVSNVTTPSDKPWGSVYELNINSDTPITALENGTIFTFMANGVNAHTVINNGPSATYIGVKYNNTSLLTSPLPIVKNIWTTNNTRPILEENKIASDYTVWMFQYDAINNWFVFLGRNPNSLIKILSSGEYDNIYADQLAYERCLWELFNYSNLNDNITLGVIPNYLLDVNCKIKYDLNNPLPRNIKEDVVEDIKYYITKQVTYPLGVSATEQNITANRIYDSGNLVGID